MAFFQQLGATKESIQELLYDIPSQNSYVGIKALKNSDVLTAVSIIAGDIARFPIIKKDSDGNIVQDEKLNYLMNLRMKLHILVKIFQDCDLMSQELLLSIFHLDLVHLTI